MSEQKLALIDGTYPQLMSGGVVATQGSKSDNLDDFKGSAYYGKSYYWPGGQTPSNAPSGANGGLLLVQQCGAATSAQIFMTHRSTNGTTPPVVYQRSQTSTVTWSDWEEIVTSDGSYHNLGAGYLAKRRRLQTDSVQQGWLKIGTVPFSSIGTWQTYSCIMIINGVFRGSAAADTAPKSGIIEIEGRKYSTTFGEVRIGVLAGDVSKDDLCWVQEDNLDVSVYIYNNYTENINITFEILSEEESDKTPANIFVWSDDITALATAPTGAVYAVVRNQASSLGGKEADEFVDTTSNQSVGGQKTFTVGPFIAPPTGTVTALRVKNIPEGSYKDVFFEAAEDGQRILTIRCENRLDDADPFVRILLGANGPNHESPSGVSVYRSSARVWAEAPKPQASADNNEIATTSWVVDKGYLTSVPTASQTVVGGAKMYVDSDGYFCIDTE